MLKTETVIIILAAGKGSRMKSNYPKVLHRLGGKTILEYVLNTAKSIKPKKIILVCTDNIKKILSKTQNISVEWVIQKQQKGTGNAIIIASKNFSDNENIIILYGDMPFISKESIKKLQESKKKSNLSLLTSNIKKPEGYGRVFRKKGKVIKIIEDKCANNKEKLIKEVYSGTFIANGKDLKRWLLKINQNNINQEFYATDIVYLAYLEGKTITTVKPLNQKEILGINNQLQLSILEKIIQQEITKNLMIAGITLKNPYHFNLRGTLKHGKNIEIDTGVILEGNVILGNDVKIGAGSIIRNSFINHQSQIKEYTIIENVKIGKNCIIGPFCHLRNYTILNNETHIGNFVEIKDSIIGKKSKIKHLSYIGNSEIGSQVNIGAGSITCNYDGFKKSKTIIGDNVFIGSNTELIAPIQISDNTTIAAGTTVIKSVDKPCLVYNTKEQKYKENWIRNKKNDKKNTN
ncbi:UDP-N-acetylglucosamine diphosphorylase/glucosamine-1-phosphate N-acetyltransferase [Buchnera aphidicola (Aphis craccivora)]|uniref:Bifunctional protein GlmU n=1 Tax=Buchnera aphidicola (Aphis craccivora) TaxID=466616 RepID=A0A4D6XNZ9_9GAMM|nr:bifunctional UDP-N-acetylglucosamine diphosphorylase/glucosamine-1-phosphate N-acetyltransferase GlmU [Buchnera aphidicola]QCI16300.1 UDP-N-acetylglucosamine diphosphorylase/glucosamine-1-phosphate N-acetyltransferase [Buchnera aphidicola (Aphis craccivora)]QLL40444.1 UDP-N-acetylglucosamine diphosphorylase/glucosamine-1-phosphate N-acetyltransferase [Buchnera aphidicola (Aphis craccivore)]WAI17815.1 MAG: bifunctional UDP-N-acetylglucosamine diphosphorylase/glucosamine-1-phosphate N-acetyltra